MQYTVAFPFFLFAIDNQWFIPYYIDFMRATNEKKDSNDFPLGSLLAESEGLSHQLKSRIFAPVFKVKKEGENLADY